ncbi:UNVERIFIED_CONTAM: hypothetical protein GTU68_028884 [Idotea baltica]|nr:hypothetical protein [Idotea baltica]
MRRPNPRHSVSLQAPSSALPERQRCDLWCKVSISPLLLAMTRPAGYARCVHAPCNPTQPTPRWVPVLLSASTRTWFLQRQGCLQDPPPALRLSQEHFRAGFPRSKCGSATSPRLPTPAQTRLTWY